MRNMRNTKIFIEAGFLNNVNDSWSEVIISTMGKWTHASFEYQSESDQPAF